MKNDRFHDHSTSLETSQEFWKAYQHESTQKPLVDWVYDQQLTLAQQLSEQVLTDTRSLATRLDELKVYLQALNAYESVFISQLAAQEETQQALHHFFSKAELAIQRSESSNTRHDLKAVSNSSLPTQASKSQSKNPSKISEK